MRVSLFGFVLLGISFPLFAGEESSLSVKAELDKALLTIGERVEYRITVTHDPAVQILSPIMPPAADVFEIKEIHDFSEKEGKQIVEGKRFTLTTYELGEFILDPVILRYRNARGEEKTVETNRLYLTVQSVDTSGKPKRDIRNVKGPIGLPRSWGWLFGLLLLLLSVGGAVFFWRQRRRRPLEEELAPGPPLSLEDEALLHLNALFDSDLIRRGKLKEYFLKLSEILRRYFERRFEILAVESTTSEILEALRAKEVPQTLREKIQQVLETADLVKFAKSKPSAPEIVQVNRGAKNVIEEARAKIAV